MLFIPTQSIQAVSPNLSDEKLNTILNEKSINIKDIVSITSYVGNNKDGFIIFHRSN